MIPTGSLLGGVFLCLTAVEAGPPAAAVRVSQDQPTLSTILEKASAYVSQYVQALSSVVSEERYEQHVTRRVPRGAIAPESQTQHRVLISDYLLVQIPRSAEWAPFRDVYSVDGVAVRDRNDRLLKLFLQPDATAVAQALRIRDESSRYNIGSVTRDINVPTFALQILGPDLRPGFAFTLRGRERVGDADTWEIEYSETAVRTIIRGRDNENVPASGRFWIDSESGAVVRTVLETRPTDMRTHIEVTYRTEPKLGILVPSEMNERHDLAEEKVEGSATYSNFRRFRVDTTFVIK